MSLGRFIPCGDGSGVGAGEVHEAEGGEGRDGIQEFFGEGLIGVEGISGAEEADIFYSAVGVFEAEKKVIGFSGEGDDGGFSAGNAVV